MSDQSRVSYGAVAKLLQTDESYGTSLFLGVTAVLRDHGMEDGVANLHPTTIREEMRDILKVRNIPQEPMDQLMAAAVIAHTDSFFEDLPTFIDICNILSGTAVSPSVFDPADIYEIAWGMTEAYLLDPPDNPKFHGDQYSEEIRGYIGYMAQEAGLMSLPGILKIGHMPREGQIGYFDDPDLVTVAADSNRTRHREIEDTVKENLGSLMAQLKMLWPEHEFSFDPRQRQAVSPSR